MYEGWIEQGYKYCDIVGWIEQSVSKFTKANTEYAPLIKPELLELLICLHSSYDYGLQLT